ncbi:MAG TPA: hypothetical protein VMR17_12865, partial [Xanthobacteraceae bacterium]|nr:hypothetical protein [Xanthobacteraceae bacterium]
VLLSTRGARIATPVLAVAAPKIPGSLETRGVFVSPQYARGSGVITPVRASRRSYIRLSPLAGTFGRLAA